MTHHSDPNLKRRRAAGDLRDGCDRLLVVFGDQLDRRAAALTSLDRERDVVLMMEVAAEATHVASHRQRTVLFLAAMRHFADDLIERGYRVRYVHLDDEDNTQSFDGEFGRAVEALAPSSVRVVRPGEWRVHEMVESWRDGFDGAFELLEDDHFWLTPAEFDAWADGRKTLVMEHFYRMMRRRLGVLVNEDGAPAGGAWNFDKENRESFDGDASALPRPRRFRPDRVTQAVIDLVRARFPDAPGELGSFHWPVTRREALAAKRDFMSKRLPCFGRYQDAMVRGEPWMFHSLLSPMLNVKLLDPRELVADAVSAWEAGDAPINAVEGFVRQLIGWREFIRGVYWREGPAYGARNGLDATGALPELYWNGDTDMACLRESLGSVLGEGFGHHIQRLMVTGNFALLAGIDPRAVSDWYLGMYVDGVDWVTLPNTLGMALHADGGVVGTKPYAASGRYISRMSDYCAGCRYDPGQRHGDDACPFTTLFWDFLLRHRRRFEDNPRMSLMIRQLERLDEAERRRVRKRARSVRVELGIDRSG